MQLVPCVACHRHVKASERACPFCGTEMSVSDLRPSGELQMIRDRTAILFGAAAVASAMAVVGCTNTPSGGDGTPVVMPYGVPVPPQDFDAGVARPQPTTTATATDSPSTAVSGKPPSTGIVMPYGVPIPHDTAPPASAKPPPVAVPAYGAPAPTNMLPKPKAQ